MKSIVLQLLHLDGVQGAGEQQTDPYLTYGQGAAQPATPQSAKSGSGAISFAGRQTDAVRAL